VKKRQLGNSSLQVSEIGLGCMSLGKDAAHAETIISAALEEGINYFDTADLYDFGVNEKIVGQSLKHVRDEVIIATKVGNRWNEAQDNVKWDASADYIKSAVKDSLSRLGTDYIDFYQLHGGMIEDNIEESISAFEELKKEGLIRYYGISSIRPNVIQKYAAVSDIQAVMMQYSLLDRRPEEWQPLFEEKQISIIARGPVAKGMLSKKMLTKASKGVKENGYLGYSYEELTTLLPNIQENLPRPLTETALQYVLANPSVATVVAGASSVEQLRENCQAVHSHPLTKEEIASLKKLTKENVYTSHRE